MTESFWDRQRRKRKERLEQVGASGKLGSGVHADGTPIPDPNRFAASQHQMTPVAEVGDPTKVGLRVFGPIHPKQSSESATSISSTADTPLDQ